jgi:hypothetical protein
MTFGNYDAANLFHIEKSKQYKKLSGRGFKTTEFVLLRSEKEQLWFIEARKTMPAITNVERLEEEILDISQKFIDSFMLTCGIWFGQNNSKAEMPNNRDRFFKYGNKVIFALIIKNSKVKLTAIAEYIKQKFPKNVRALWSFSVVVLNEEMAAEEKIMVLEKK